MKKALIIENGVVAQVSDTSFEVAAPYYWVDCQDEIVGGYVYQYVDQQFTLIAKPTHINTAEENKKLAQQALLESDFSVLPDVNLTNKAEWETYRAALRSAVVNPQAGNVNWPTKPQTIWG